MGIRFKIWLTFMVCVGLMTGISLFMLEQRMTQSFERIEHRDMTAHMTRVQQALAARLEALNTMTQDWASWIELNQFARRPNPLWARQNIGPSDLLQADLSLLLVYDTQQRLIAMSSLTSDGSPLALPSLADSAEIMFLRTQTPEPGCGLMGTEEGLMLTCWARLQSNDRPLATAGTMIMGRLLDAPLLKKMGEQVRLPFDLLLTTAMPQGLTRWATDLPGGALGANEFFASSEPSVYHLYYPLTSLLGQRVGLISLDVSREVHLQSLQLFERVRLEQLAAAAVMALLLFAGLHLLLIRRLKRLQSQLGDLAGQSTWTSRIDIRGHDELAMVATRVNTLLALIQSQVGDLNTLSRTDPLTGLANRRAFDAALARELARAHRHGQPLSLLMVDVDHFKRYNDHYGHLEGDHALQALAGVLQSSVRLQPDMVVRLGGEEFAILLPDTDMAGARQTAQRLQANLQARGIEHAASPVAPLLTVSIGMAQARNESADDLLTRADQALYQAKEQGRNRTQCAG